MSSVRGSGNRATELRMVEMFRSYGIRGWRRNVSLSGRPDFVFRKDRVAVFIDGCFWHGCPKHGSTPEQNHGFWKRKLANNKKRDRHTTKLLRLSGWKVLRIWQHELLRKNERALTRRVRSVLLHHE